MWTEERKLRQKEYNRIYANKQKKWHCPTCNIEIHHASKAYHMKSKQHISKSEQPPYFLFMDQQLLTAVLKTLTQEPEKYTVETYSNGSLVSTESVSEFDDF